MAVTVACLGWYWAWRWYVEKTGTAGRLKDSHAPLYELLCEKYRIDELYDLLLVRPTRRMADWAGSFDRWVVDGLVEGAGIGATLTGEVFRHFSSGRVRTYALAVFIGAAGLVTWLWLQ